MDREHGTARYGLALLATALALGVQYAILSASQVSALGILYPATFLIAWYLGLRPALFSIAVGVLGAYYLFFEPRFTFQARHSSELLRLGLFILTSVLIAAVIDRGRKAERKFREGNDRYRIVGRATRDAIWDWNLLTDEVSWNEAIVSQLGHRPEDRHSRAAWWYEHIHPSDRETVTHAVHDLIDSGGEFWQGEYRFRKGDGTYARVLDRGFVVHDARGRAVRMLGAMQDTTDRELALHEAREALRVRDEFMSIASHELKTPLTSLHLHLQVLRRQAQKAERRGEPGMIPVRELDHALSVCERQSQKLAALLDELLDLTRVRLGRLKLARQPTDLAEVVRHAIAVFQEEADQKGYLITLEPVGASALGSWDRGRIEQAVGHLISNAIKYGEGRPIEIRVEGPDAAGGMARLRVIDHGMGIASEMTEKIFERFERAVSSRQISGLGLGLYLSRQIVEAHGGRLSVNTRPGMGSTFTLELPAEMPGSQAPKSA